MKITVLDGFAVNPGDLDWGILSPYGEVTVYDRTASDDESIARIRESEIMAELEESGAVIILGAIYDIASGEVRFLDSADLL